jgi:hypothetical protein
MAVAVCRAQLVLAGSTSDAGSRQLCLQGLWMKLPWAAAGDGCGVVERNAAVLKPAFFQCDEHFFNVTMSLLVWRFPAFSSPQCCTSEHIRFAAATDPLLGLEWQQQQQPARPSPPLSSSPAASTHHLSLPWRPPPGHPSSGRWAPSSLACTRTTRCGRQRRPAAGNCSTHSQRQAAAAAMQGGGGSCGDVLVVTGPPACHQQQ